MNARAWFSSLTSDEQDATRRRIERCGCDGCRAFLLRLSELATARGDGLAGTSRALSEAPNVAASPTADLLGAGASPIAARASHQRGAASPERHVPPRVRSGNFSNERRVT